MIRKAASVLGLLVMSLPVLAKGDVQAGEKKAMMCVACHGANGVSTVALYPTIAGQSETYLSQAMHAYKKGERSGGQAEIMKAYVSGLSDADIENLAAYYASKGKPAQ